MQLLLEAGADPNDLMKEGAVLRVAIDEGNELIVKHLLKANADFNLRYEAGFHGVRDRSPGINLVQAIRLINLVI